MEHEPFQKNEKKPKNFDFYGTIILFLEHTVNKSEYTIGEILEEGKALLSNSSMYLDKTYTLGRIIGKYLVLIWPISRIQFWPK